MENISKALELLRLPEEMGGFNGQVNTLTKNVLIEKRTYDYTKLVGGKATVSSVFESQPSTSLHGQYALNMFSNYLHGFNFDAMGYVGENYILDKPSFEKTISAGPFAGKTYWFPWQKVVISPVDGGFDSELFSEPWMNTTRTGLPEPTGHVNPSMSVTRIDYIKTKDYTKMLGKSYPVYTKEQLLSKGMSEETIAQYSSWVFHIKTADDSKFIKSLANDIQVDGDNYSGTAYINGILSKDIPFRQLTTSFGQKAADFVVEWRLFNGVVNDSIYGSTWRKRYTSTEPNNIKIVAGNAFSYNEITNVLTYNQNDTQAEILFCMEFLPAQGKNEGWGVVLDLPTGLKRVWA